MPGLLQWRNFRPTDTAFMTWPAMYGSGPATGTVPITTSNSPRRAASPEIRRGRTPPTILPNQRNQRRSSAAGPSCAPINTVPVSRLGRAARAKSVRAQTISASAASSCVREPRWQRGDNPNINPGFLLHILITGDRDLCTRPVFDNESIGVQERVHMHLGRRVGRKALCVISVIGALTSVAGAGQGPAAGNKRPNILVIMGDDVGWFNIGAYHRGIMSGKTPNLDRLADEGMMFTDYYAEASCTAGRANFITGELPIRTGLTTVGQAGADVGLPAQAVTLATVLKSLGYETAQFGKNHLGDLNKFLPCVHGFDEYFGYLYHLDAMSDPYWFDYPQDWIDKTGPRNLTHCWATDTDDTTVQPRWGAI